MISKAKRIFDVFRSFNMFYWDLRNMIFIAKACDLKMFKFCCEFKCWNEIILVPYAMRYHILVVCSGVECLILAVWTKIRCFILAVWFRLECIILAMWSGMIACGLVWHWKMQYAWWNWWKLAKCVKTTLHHCNLAKECGKRLSWENDTI